MKRLLLQSSITLAALFAAVGMAEGQILYEANFDTNGDFEGWVDFSNRLSSSSITGGVWAGTGGTNNDPQLRTAEGTVEVDLNGLGEATLLIRAKNSTGEQISGGLSYISYLGAAATNTAGLPVVNFSINPTEADTFETFAINAKSIIDGLADTDGILRSIRLDPLNAAPITGKTFEIDFVRLAQFDAGDANLDGLVDVLDFELISDNLFSNVAIGTSGDLTDDGVVNYADFSLWRERSAILGTALATIPEPTSLAIVAGALGLIALRRRNTLPTQLLLLPLVAVLLATAGPAQAQLAFESDFNTNGDFEGWTFENASGSVNSGLLSGSVTTGNDPQLLYEDSTIGDGSFRFDSLVYRVRDNTLPTEYDPTGIAVVLSASGNANSTVIVGNTMPELFTAVASGDDFFTVTVDISSFNGADIDSLRVDPIGGPSAVTGSFDVDFVELYRGPLLGDVNNDGVIDLTDKTILRDNLFETGLTRAEGDLNLDGIVDFNDYREWKRFFVPSSSVQVPEPGSLAICGLGLLMLGAARRSRLGSSGVAAMVALLAVSVGVDSAQAIDIEFSSANGNYTSGSNWSGGNVPDGGFDEVAIIGSPTQTSAVANISSAVAERPGGVTLGNANETSGTLNISSGGTLIVQPGVTVGAGNLNVGVGTGTGIVNLTGNGSLTAESIFVVGAAGSELNLDNTSTLNLNGNLTLGRNSRITGPNVNLNVGGNLSMQGISTHTAQITGPTHSTINVGGSTQLGGTLLVDFDGFSPVAGNSWSLFDSAGFTGGFSAIQTPGVTLGLGERFTLSTIDDAGSTNGQVGRLALEQLLVLEVNRNDSSVAIRNPSGATGVALDGYTVASGSGSLDSSSWTTLEGNLPGWEAAQNASNNRVTEIRPIGEGSVNASSSLSLGGLYSPNVSTFGVTGEDLSFQYTREDGTNLTGLVQYVGEPSGGFNTLVLQIDPTTGEAQLRNDSGLFDGEIWGYDVASASDSLLSGDGDWLSLDDANAAGGDWRESNVSSGRIAELKQDDETLLVRNGANRFNLGTLFDTSGEQDLVFQFLQAGETTPTAGIVVYEAIGAGVPGDYNNDGIVNAADYTIFRDNVNSSFTLSNENPAATTPGIVDAEDYAFWEANYGSTGAATATSSAIPEPACLLLVAFGLAGVVSTRRAG